MFPRLVDGGSSGKREIRPGIVPSAYCCLLLMVLWVQNSWFFLQHHQCLLGFPTSAPATIVSDAVSLCLSHMHHVTPAQPPHPGLSSGVTLTLTMATLWLPPTPSLPHLPVGAREQLQIPLEEAKETVHHLCICPKRVINMAEPDKKGFLEEGLEPSPEGWQSLACSVTQRQDEFAENMPLPWSLPDGPRPKPPRLRSKGL